MQWLTLVSWSITLQEVVLVLDVMAGFHKLGNPELPHAMLNSWNAFLMIRMASYSPSVMIIWGLQPL